MIIEATDGDFAALLDGTAPGDLRLVPGSPIAEHAILRMLRDLAASIRPGFAPSAWMMVEDDEIVGLCSIVGTPDRGVLQIGYGVAPARQGSGAATRAIGQLMAWARLDDRVRSIEAETNVVNIASQRVLERNGFVRVGERVDDEDGDLICWRADAD
jgi:RimJ/RimL family protein N-acetyltransferase